MADANRVSLIYVPETVFGTTPANSAAWKHLQFTGETLEPTYGTAEDQTIRDDRMSDGVIQTSGTAAGEVDCTLRAGALDDFLEAVTGGTWTTNVLKVGTVQRSFSIEKKFADLASGNKFEIMKGASVNKLDLSIQWGAISTAKVGFMGASWSDSATSAVGTGSVLVLPVKHAYNGSLDITNVKVDGVASTLYFKQLTLSLMANLQNKTAIGDVFPYGFTYGHVGVQATAQAYFDNRSLETKVRSGAPFAMEFTISDGTDSYDILIPNAYFTSRSGLNASKRDGDVVTTVNFSGAADATTGTSIQITRVIT